MENFLYVVPVLGVVGLLYMALKAKWVTAQDAGDSKMQGIATAIAEGAMAFLRAEYRILAIYMVIAGTALGILSQIVESSHILIVLSFVIGCWGLHSPPTDWPA